MGFPVSSHQRFKRTDQQLDRRQRLGEPPPHEVVQHQHVVAAR
jgi:hypothetical protein